MTFKQWSDSLPSVVTSDAVWRLGVYRLALYAHALAYEDAAILARDGTTRLVAGQVERSMGSIAANVAEGFSRNSRRDRARLYEYALCSAREAVVWYVGARNVLGEQRVLEVLEVLQHIRRQLITAVQDQRRRAGR